MWPTVAAVVLVVVAAVAAMARAQQRNDIVERATDRVSSRAEELEALIRYHKDLYYNGVPEISDAAFDALEDELRDLKPASKALRVGAPPKARRKITLKYQLPSQNKLKSDESIARWAEKHPGRCVVWAKMDGVSGLVEYDENGEVLRISTRGDGVTGQDVTANMLDKVPAKVTVPEMAVRGEFIIPKSKFVDAWGSNARNTVSGLINAERVVKNAGSYKAMQFIAYEVRNPVSAPSDAIEILDANGFKIARHETCPPELSVENLSAVLRRWRDYDYDHDGLVVAHDKGYPEVNSVVKDVKNPTWSFAFKGAPSEVAEVRVGKVLWKVSKNGMIKPTVELAAPVRLMGVNVSRATGHNLAYIKRNRIGPGAIVRVTRSGDVIPHITGVVKMAPAGSLPPIPYKESASGIDAIADDASASKLPKVVFFAKSLGIMGLGERVVTKLFEAGVTREPGDLFHSSESELASVLGAKVAAKVWLEINRVRAEADYETLAVASGLLGTGIGVRKMRAVTSEVPAVTRGRVPSEDEIRKAGLGKETAARMARGIARVQVWMKRYGLERPQAGVRKVPEPALGLAYEASGRGRVAEFVNNGFKGELVGEHVVFTGFRDAALEKKLAESGAEVSGSITKKTTTLLVKALATGEMASSKVRKARSAGIQIVTMSPRAA